MSAITTEAVLAAVCGDPDFSDDWGDWSVDEDGWVVRDGDHCDGDPTWTLIPSWDGVQVYYMCGWYEQQGDAADTESMLRLMRAMLDAADALDAALKVTP